MEDVQSLLGPSGSQTSGSDGRHKDSSFLAQVRTVVIQGSHFLAMIFALVQILMLADWTRRSLSSLIIIMKVLRDFHLIFNKSGAFFLMWSLDFILVLFPSECFRALQNTAKYFCCCGSINKIPNVDENLR